MQIKERLASSPKTEPYTVEAGQLVAEAVAGMAEHNYGSAIVVDGDRKVVGILTERDILKRLVNVGLDAKATAVSVIMTANPSLARESDEIEDWMRTMTKDRFRRIPVVDENDRIKAVLTQTDMVAYSWPVLMQQAKEIAEINARKNYTYLLIGGGVLVYSIAMVFLLSGL